MSDLLIRGVVPIACLLAAWPISAAVAADDERPETEIVFRVSRKLFVDLTREEVSLNLTIDETFQGMPVSGDAQGKGLTKVKLETSDDDMFFNVRIQGVAQAVFRGDARAAAALASSNVPFEAEKRVRFDGTKFLVEPVKISATNRTTIDRVMSRRRGLIGRFVRRIAWRKARQSLPEMETFVNQYAEREIGKHFDQMTADLVSKLNEMTKLEETITELYPDVESWPFRLSTRKDYLQAEWGPENARPAELPEEAQQGPKNGMELWIRTSPVKAVLANVTFFWNSSQDLLQEHFSDDEARKFSDHVEFTTEGSWIVIRVGRGAIEEAKEQLAAD